MVKGLNRRVVTVRFPENGVFEQAIFMVREDAMERQGGSVESVLREACRIAEGYAPAVGKRAFPWLYSLVGGGVVGIIWVVSTMI